MFEKHLKKNSGSYLFVFRVIVGILFIQHGLQKLFGLFGGVDGQGGTVSLGSLFGAAGVIEFVAGILIILGLFTRITAVIAGIELLFAYFIGHASKSIIPLMNGGELALLFCACFIVLLAFGPGKFSLEKALFKKEIV